MRRLPGIKLGAMLALYLGLCLGWNLATPLFEGPDAYYHFAVIEYLHRTGSLPPREDAAQRPWQQMAFHAPLYYELSAALISPIDTSDFESGYRLNPHAAPGEPDAGGNRNFVAHVGDPWTGTGLAVRIVRLLSSLLGAMTLLGIYALTRLLMPDRPGVAYLAVLLVMFNPQFLFIHTIISNDTLVTALSTVTLAGLIYLLRRRISPWHVALLGVLLGLSALAKASGLALYPPVLVALLFGRFPQPVTFRRRVIYLLLIGVIGLLIAGGWYAANWLQLGDAAATAQIAAVTGARGGPIADVGGELRGMALSFWGVFGWFNILAPQAFYGWIDLILVLCTVGLLWAIFRERLLTRQPRFETLLLLLYAVTFSVAWWRFNLLVNASQGRLFFPLIGLLALILASGLIRWPRPVQIVAVAGLGLWAALLPVTVVAPAYTIQPPVVAADWQPPADAATYLIREPWEEEPCLQVTARLIPWEGGTTPVTIETWWQTRCPISGYWSVFVHFVDVTQETCEVGKTDYILAQTDGMLQGGKLPFPALEAGEVYSDRLTIDPPPDLPDDRAWDVQFGLYDAGGGSGIRAFVTEVAAQPTFGIGQCAPETIQIRLTP